MGKLVLNYIGEDYWSRPVYKDENGRLFKDVNCGSGKIELCTVCGDFEGEPNTHIENLEKYQGVEIEIIGMEDEPTSEEKFNYMMLGRLQSDCNYYLGYGNRNKNNLWAGSVDEQINEMKRLFNSFEDNKKPEWVTWDDILNYESKMNE